MRSNRQSGNAGKNSNEELHNVGCCRVTFRRLTQPLEDAIARRHYANESDSARRIHQSVLGLQRPRPHIGREPRRWCCAKVKCIGFRGGRLGRLWDQSGAAPSTRGHIARGADDDSPSARRGVPTHGPEMHAIDRGYQGHASIDRSVDGARLRSYGQGCNTGKDSNEKFHRV